MRSSSLLLSMLVLAPLAADARPKKAAGGGANAHAAAAAKAHKDGKFDVALTELQAAYAAEPDPKYLFAIAQVQAKLDSCQEAIASYEKFLASTKDDKKRAVVKQAIEACKTKLASAAPAAPGKPEGSPFRERKPDAPAAVSAPAPAAGLATPEATPQEPVPGPATVAPPAPVTAASAGPGPAPRPRRSPWYKDVLGDALTITGAAAGAASLVMYAGARGDLDDAERQASLDEYQDLVDQAQDKRRFAVIVAGAGAVLIGAGIVRYATRDRHESRGIAIAPTDGGGLVTWSGGF